MKKSIIFFPPLWPPSTIPRQKFILTWQKITFFSKKLPISYKMESERNVGVSWHIDLKNEIKKIEEKKINYFPRKGEGGSRLGGKFRLNNFFWPLPLVHIIKSLVDMVDSTVNSESLLFILLLGSEISSLEVAPWGFTGFG